MTFIADLLFVLGRAIGAYLLLCIPVAILGLSVFLLMSMFS